MFSFKGALPLSPGVGAEADDFVGGEGCGWFFVILDCAAPDEAVTRGHETVAGWADGGERYLAEAETAVSWDAVDELGFWAAGSTATERRGYICLVLSLVHRFLRVCLRWRLMLVRSAWKRARLWTMVGSETRLMRMVVIYAANFLSNRFVISSCVVIVGWRLTETPYKNWFPF